MVKSLYDRHWQRRRAEQLRLHPLCRLHLAMRGEVVVATVADHVVPHRGDLALFAGPLQSLCAPCHNSYKQELERTGSFKGCDLQGFPLCPFHPWNQPLGTRGRGDK